jgi:hypothetical protein
VKINNGEIFIFGFGLCQIFYFHYRVGQFISTKAVGKWEREDITRNYKYPESEYKMQSK